MFGVVIIAILVMGYFLVLNSKAENKGTALLEKAITAVLSTIVFSLYLAYLGYTPVEEQQAGVGYTSFEGLLIIYTMFSFPIFLICGGLYSFFVDAYFEKIYFHNTLLIYLSGVFVYLVGGLLIVGVFIAAIYLMDGNMNGLLLDYLKISAVPSLLFYHISLLTKQALRFIAR